MSRYLFLLVGIVFFVCACDVENNIVEPFVDNRQVEDSIIMAEIQLAGDFNISEMPLTRGLESDDLLGIQILKDGEAFCFGLFNDLTNLKVALLAGHTYSVEATMVKHTSTYNNEPFRFFYYVKSTRYLYEFKITNINKFIYDKQYNCNSFSNGRSFIPSDPYKNDLTYGKKEYCQKIDRFYGKINNYVPTVNGNIQLHLRRVSFGIKMKVSGLTDGSLDMKCCHNKSSNYVFYSNPSITSNVETQTEIYSLYNIVDAWQYADDDYQEAVTLSVVWTRGNGIVQNLGTKTAYVKRNAVNVFKIKLTTNDTDVDVDVDPEGGEMGDEDEDLSN